MWVVDLKHTINNECPYVLCACIYPKKKFLQDPAYMSNTATYNPEYIVPTMLIAAKILDNLRYVHMSNTSMSIP